MFILYLRNRITQPTNFIACQVMTEANISLFFVSEHGREPYVALLPVEENEKLHVFDKVNFHGQHLSKGLPLDSSTAYCMLLFSGLIP
jgi:hypothetical protein